MKWLSVFTKKSFKLFLYNSARNNVEMKMDLRFNIFFKLIFLYFFLIFLFIVPLWIWISSETNGYFCSKSAQIYWWFFKRIWTIISSINENTVYFFYFDMFSMYCFFITRFGSTRVHFNAVYNELIKNRHHVHMNRFYFFFFMLI